MSNLFYARSLGHSDMKNHLIILLILLFNSYTLSVLAEDQTITLSGVVLSEQSQPLSGMTVNVANQSVMTDDLGFFQLNSLARHNQLLTVSNPSYRDEIIALHLLKAQDVSQLRLNPIIMSSIEERPTRFVFGGDSSFGRRYIDPDESTPRNQLPDDDPGALVSVSDPVPGSQAVVQYIRPIFLNADWSVVNLETPVTSNTSTPHEQKDFAFFTLPDSMQALNWLGIDYVSLGNNHLYDYLDIGIVDTISTLTASGIHYSGAGLNSEQAYQSHRQIINGADYSFLSMTSVSGSKHEINYVASENKGGAADLRDHDALADALQLDLANNSIPIAQLHGGKEYTFEPTENFMRHIEFSVAAGAKLVVGHHPHVAQGVGLIDDVVTIHSLGNLIFDQARLETMLGLVARVDMDEDQVKEVRFYPIYTDNFIPKLISGDLANRFLRRIGEFSNAYGALVYPYNHQGWVTFDSNEVAAIDRVVTTNFTIPSTGVTVVDLRQLADSTESLLSVTSDNNEISIQIGRDILNHGDFEDWDIDDAGLVASRWDSSNASSQICSDNTYKGSAALCSTRSSRNSSDSVISFRNRVRVMGESTGEPNDALSLFTYIYGENAGEIKIVSRFHASVGDLTFGEEDSLKHPGGTFDWQAVMADVHMPIDSVSDINDVENNPRALRLFIRQSPPNRGDSLAIFDEFAVINWEEQVVIGQENNLITPHARDFLRVEGAPGEYHLSLKFRKYQPVNSHFVGLSLTANNVNHITSNEQTGIAIKLKLQQHLPDNPLVDWWVNVITQTGEQFSYVLPTGWQAGQFRAITSPLVNIPEFSVFSGRLPKGDYRVSFCIDTNVDTQRNCVLEESVTIEIE